MMDTVILVLIVSALASQQLALCQDEASSSSRVASDKVGSVEGGGLSVGGGGQSRAIYSPRHLSPHRMMHFGKRPEGQQVPMIMTPLDLFETQRVRRSNIYSPTQPDGNKLAPLFSFRLERGQELQAVPTPDESLAMEDLNKKLLYNLEWPQRINAPGLSELAILAAIENARLAGNLQHQQLEQNQHVPFGSSAGPKSLRLMNEEGDNGSSGEQQSAINEGERTQPSSNAQEDGQQGISISTRSMPPSGRRLGVNSVPTLLIYGRGGLPSIGGFGSYNKKAEPKENFFMHFGRK